jgi:RsiW-degrading membrane proteinase PrsW (M82 family)
MFTAALLPALIILLYFRERESYVTPAQAIWSAFVIGALMAFPVLAVAGFVVKPFIAPETLHLKSLATAFLQAAIPEECFKLLAVTLVFGKHPDLRHPHQILVVSVAVATGFAAFENMFYLDEAKNWSLTAMFRSVTAVPGHAFTGAIMGAGLAAARGSSRRLFYAAALIVPILLHGLYDYFIFLKDGADLDKQPSMLALGAVAVACFAIIVLSEGLLALRVSNRLLNVRPPPQEPFDAGRLIRAWSARPRLRGAFWMAMALVLISAGALLMIGSVVFGIMPWVISFERTEIKETALAVLPTAVVFGLFGLFHGTMFFAMAKQLLRRVRLAQT